MALQLIARNYLQGSKWQIKPRNIVDTVGMHLKYGVSSDDVIHTQRITSGTLYNFGDSVELPLSDDFIKYSLGSNGVSVNNVLDIGGGTVRQGTAVTILDAISGSYEITLEYPLLSPPSVSWKLEGLTTYISRGEKTQARTPDQIYSDAIVSGKNPYQYIQNNAKGSSEFVDGKSYDKEQRASLDSGLLMDYTGASIPYHPYIRKITENYTGTWEEYKNSALHPSQADVFCRWDNYDYNLTASGATFPVYNSWDYSIGRPAYRQGPPIWDDDFSEQNGYDMNNKFIPLYNSYFQPSCTITKKNNLTYVVDYILPVRYLQIAAARTWVPTPNTYVQDSYGWKDVASAIVITVHAQQVDDTVENISYSLDASGQLTTDVKNVFPLEFAENEFITRDALYGGTLWSQRMPTYLLGKFKKGKYVVTCKVKENWATENDIHVNTEVQIQMPSGRWIYSSTDESTVATFSIKNIEKVFSGSEFAYELSLLEV